MGSPSSRSPEDQHQQDHHQHTHNHQQPAMIQHRPFDPTTGSSMDPTHPSSSSAAMAPFPYSDPQQPRYDTASQASQYLPRPPVLRPPPGDNHYMSVAQPFAGSASIAPYGLPAPSGAGGQLFMHGYHTDAHAPAPTPFPSYSTHPYGEPSSFFHSPMPNDAFPSRSAFPAYASHDMNPPYMSTSRGSSRSGLHDAPERPSSLGSLGRSQSYASLQNQPRPASSSASTMSMQPAAGPIRRPATMHGHQPDPRSMSYGSFGGINEYAHLSRNPSGSSSSDSYVHVPISRHRVTTTLWEDEGTLCFQVDANGICVARRHDNNMVNGTKLLNVCDLTRGKRDAILKSEKERAVVKVGAMHLKGVWIAFDRAKELARMYNIMDKLYPIFEPDIQSFLYHPDNYSRAGVAEVSRDRQNSRHGKIPELMRSTSEADAVRDLKRPSSGVKRNYDSFATPGPIAAPSLARSNTAPALPRAMAPLQRGYSDVQVPGRITTSASPSQQHAEPDRRYDANSFETHGSLALSNLTGTRTSPDAYRRFSPMSNAPLSAPSHISSDHALRRILNVHDNGSPSGTSTPTSVGGMHSGRSGLAAFGMPGESPADDGREQRDYFPALKRGRHDTATSSGSGEVSEAIEAAREKTYSLSLTGSTRTSPVGQHASTSTWAAGTSLLSPDAVAGGSTDLSAAGNSGHAHGGSSGSGDSSGQNPATLWSLGGEQNKDSASAYAQALLSTPSLQ